MKGLKIESIYQELIAEMRWRRDTEFKLLAVHIALLSASLVFLLQSSGSDLYLAISSEILVLVLIICSCKLTTSKIRREHKVYSYLGDRVRLIWEENGLFESQGETKPILLENSRNFGKGEGFRESLDLINWSTVAMFFFVIGHFIRTIHPYL